MGQLARTPEELSTLLEDAFLLRDPDAIADLFERHALLLVDGGCRQARGHNEIATVAGAIWASDRTYLATPGPVIRARDTALLLGPAPGVARRARDGSWRYAISLLATETRSR